MNRLSIATSVSRCAYSWCAALVAPASVALLVGCQPDVRVIEGPSNCSVSGNGVFISAGFQVQHSLPRKCPILVTQPVWGWGGMGVWYEAIQTVAAGGPVVANTIVFTNIYNASGANKRAMESPLTQWGSVLRADITGTYNAASVEPGCTGCQLNDLAIQTVAVSGSGGGEAVADVRLPYRQAFLAEVDGPGSIGYGEYFTLTASVTSLARLPVTYEWFVGGQSAGPPSQSASSFSDWGNNEGAQQTYQVLVTDVEGGQVWSDPHSVFVSYSGGSGCEPWMIECP